MRLRLLALTIAMPFLMGCPSAAQPAPHAGDASTADVQGLRITPDVIYHHKAGVALTFDVYQPEESNGAAVIFVNSGGWRAHWGWRQWQVTENPKQAPSLRSRGELHSGMGQFYFRPLFACGFTVFAVRHGSSPWFRMPEIVNDLRWAIHFIRGRAPDYAVDPDRIGIWGGSAGGHLSLLLATTGNDRKRVDFSESTPPREPLAAVVAYFPPSDLKRLFDFLTREVRDRFPATYMEAEEYPVYSPLSHVSSDDPPTLIIHGDKDTLVPLIEGTSMHKALTDSGVVSRMVVIPGAGHVFTGADAETALKESIA